MKEDPDRLLQTLDPPSRGWERLLERRAAKAADRPAWIAFAGGAVAAAIALLALDLTRAPPLSLSTAGARLEGRPVGGDTLRLLDEGRVTALPAAPGVRLYWAEPTARR
jgi:hypothetical protein